eukprot:4452033-Prymnesium_polylepis.3
MDVKDLKDAKYTGGELLAGGYTVEQVKRGGYRALDLKDTADVGLEWQELGARKPERGKELNNLTLAEALKTKTKFRQDEWVEFNIENLTRAHFIKSGDEYFQPAAANITARSILKSPEGLAEGGYTMLEL